MPPIPAIAGRTRPTKPPRRARPRSAAFTILEVAGAVAILAMAIATSITTLESGYKMIDTARNTTIAGQVLQSLIEDLRLQTWTTVSGLPSSLSGTLSTFDTVSGHVQSASFTGYSATETAILNRFTIIRTITDVTGFTDLSGVSNMKCIVFSATWTGIDGRSHTVNYTTYYAKDGLYAYYST